MSPLGCAMSRANWHLVRGDHLKTKVQPPTRKIPTRKGSAAQTANCNGNVPGSSCTSSLEETIFQEHFPAPQTEELRGVPGYPLRPKAL